MKLYVLTLFFVITGSALYGSTTAEIPMVEIRNNMMARGNIAKASRLFINSITDPIDHPHIFIAAVQEFIHPLVEGNDIETKETRYALKFLLFLIRQLNERYGSASALITHQLANFSFSAFDDKSITVRDLPIIYITAELMSILLMQPLLEAGANPNAVDPLYGTTPLMIAAQYTDQMAAKYNQEIDFLAALKLLIKYGANPLLTDKSGKTARDYALQHGNIKAAAYLYFVGRDAPDKSDFDEGDI